MHKANAMWWQECSENYPQWFRYARVLELGSYDVNGGVRQFFTDPVEYVGVDWRAGPGVDFVSLAHEYGRDERSGVFDTIISASMLEHDPHWRASLINCIQMLAPRGGLFLSWGAALNPPHDIATAPDGLFHCLPAGHVIAFCRAEGLYVHEFRYEYRLPYVPEDAKKKLDKGCVGLVAFRSAADAPGKRFIDELLPEDQVQ